MTFPRRISVSLVLAAAACGDDGGRTFETSLSASEGTALASTSLESDAGSSTGDPGTGSGTGDDATSLVTEPWATSGSSSSTTDATDGATSEATSTTDDTTGTTGDPLAECPHLRVITPGEVLNVRPTPSTAEAPVGTLPNGTLVDTLAAVDGEVIDGVSLWYQMEGGGLAGYVFSSFVECTFDEPPPPPEGFWLPFACGLKTNVTQGNNGDVSHQGKDYYAFDFGVGLGTPLKAMAAGTVDHIYDLTKPGDPCYNGGGPECSLYGNLVVILHGDNTETYYKHLSEVQVKVGQPLAQGEQIGLSGTTGYSTGPHAHIMRQDNCGSAKCQSIPLSFIEAGVPVKGQSVTSMNCP